MILVDTTVWVEYFRQHEPIANQVAELLAEEKVITVEPVFSELMFGVRNVQEKAVIKTFWQILPRVEFGADSLFDASSFAFQSDFCEMGIGLFGAVIIRSAQTGGHLIWTLDEKIKSVMDSSQLFQWD